MNKEELNIRLEEIMKATEQVLTNIRVLEGRRGEIMFWLNKLEEKENQSLNENSSPEFS